jgi:hypothetical protein
VSTKTTVQKPSAGKPKSRHRTVFIVLGGLLGTGLLLWFVLPLFFPPDPKLQFKASMRKAYLKCEERRGKAEESGASEATNARLKRKCEYLLKRTRGE